MKKINHYFRNLKMRHKLVLVFLLTSLASLGINIFVYVNLNTALYKMDEVYSSNISLNNISDSLEKIHVSLTGFLETKGTDELETYYKYEQEIKTSRYATVGNICYLLSAICASEFAHSRLSMMPYDLPSSWVPVPESFVPL